MPLKNAQYDILMRMYDRRQLDNRYDQQKRITRAYTLSPRLREIDQEIGSLSAQRAKLRILGNGMGASESLKAATVALQKERGSILEQLGLPRDYLEMRYHCPDCRDTGYIGSEKCHCFKQAAVNLLYDQSNIRAILERENFSSFSLSYYSDGYDPDLGQSIRDYMQSILLRCKDFAASYPEKGQNIMFTGTTGVGKTFLSNCIAKALIERCFSVVYLTATELFDIFSRACFSYEEEAAEDIDHYILDSDMLIIDDLGTERANAFTVSKLFYCINEHLVRKKGTLISTNLKPGEIRDLYTERVASRILSHYEIISLFGDDIRIVKKFGSA